MNKGKTKEGFSNKNNKSYIFNFTGPAKENPRVEKVNVGLNGHVRNRKMEGSKEVFLCFQWRKLRQKPTNLRFFFLKKR